MFSLKKIPRKGLSHIITLHIISSVARYRVHSEYMEKIIIELDYTITIITHHDLTFTFSLDFSDDFRFEVHSYLMPCHNQSITSTTICNYQSIKQLDNNYFPIQISTYSMSVVVVHSSKFEQLAEFPTEYQTSRLKHFMSAFQCQTSCKQCLVTMHLHGGCQQDPYWLDHIIWHNSTLVNIRTYLHKNFVKVNPTNTFTIKSQESLNEREKVIWHGDVDLQIWKFKATESIKNSELGRFMGAVVLYLAPLCIVLILQNI